MSTKKLTLDKELREYLNKWAHKTRHKAVLLCCNSNGPKLSYDEAATFLNISPKSVKLWIKLYKRTGLLGHLDMKETAVLCILKKNQDIKFDLIKNLLNEMGFNISYRKLKSLLKNLKPIFLNESFYSSSEEEILDSIKKLSEFQYADFKKTKCKNNLAHSQEHTYAKVQPHKSYYDDHNYALLTDSSSDESEMPLDTINGAINIYYETLNYKIGLFREQLAFLCLDSKGPRKSLAFITNKMKNSTSLIKELINQVKSINQFISRQHVNKCCGRIQLIIIRLYILNSGITIDQIISILENVQIFLTELVVQRYLNSLQYLLESLIDFEEIDQELIIEADLNNCIQELKSIINPKSRSKTIRTMNEQPTLTFDKIVKLSSLENVNYKNNVESNGKKSIDDEIFQYEIHSQKDINTCNNFMKETTKSIKNHDFKNINSENVNDNQIIINNALKDKTNNLFSNQLSLSTSQRNHNKNREIELIEIKSEPINTCNTEDEIFSEYNSIEQEEINIEEISFSQYTLSTENCLLSKTIDDNESSYFNENEELNSHFDHTEIKQEFYENIVVNNIKEEVDTIWEETDTFKTSLQVSEAEIENITILLNDTSESFNIYDNKSKKYENDNVESSNNMHDIKNVISYTNSFENIENNIQIKKESDEGALNFFHEKVMQNQVNVKKIETGKEDTSVFSLHSSKIFPTYKKRKRKCNIYNLELESCNDFPIVKTKSKSNFQKLLIN